MIITVASGKGGTGKTTVACSLALSVQDLMPVVLDCDVEAPNAHLALQPALSERQTVSIRIPEVQPERCTACGRCGEVCPFHAIVMLGEKVLVFPELCHGCGSCTRNCPEGAITEVEKPIGIVEGGKAAAGFPFAHGILNIGEPMAVPIIRRLKDWEPASDETLVIRDAPPGTACPVVETLRGADFALMVTEPTPFGLHDLRLAADVAKAIGVPAGVVINRDGVGDESVDDFCRENGLPILMRIPLSREIGEATARGQSLVDAFPEYLPRFQELFTNIQTHVQDVRAEAMHAEHAGSEEGGGDR
ncbi:MAG: ATP-binding protein [Anaerolineales bacterium]|jgi:MinD superfamily P-loop ATPase